MKSSIIVSILVLGLLSSASPLDLHKRRFNQEKPAVLQEIRDLGRLPNVPADGRFDVIAGAFIGTLLAGADACARYALIDEIITNSKNTGNGAPGIAVAQKLAAVEKNFDPTGANPKPAFCTDANLPVSVEVRCIVPVIDPAFPGATEFNGKANDRLQLVVSGQLGADACAGQSVAQQAVALGLTDCVGCESSAADDPTESADDQAAETTAPEATLTYGTRCGGGASSTPAATETTPTGGEEDADEDTDPDTDDKDPANGDSLNKFTGALLGAAPVKVINVGGGRPFQVILADGTLNGDFIQVKGALTRACDVQKNLCANIANSDVGRQQGVSVGDCDAQNAQCRAANGI